MPLGVLKLKIASCVTMPTRRYLRLMDERLLDCNRVRNAVVRGWLRWREDNPEWQPQQRRTRDGSPKVDSKGAPVVEDAMVSQQMEASLFHVYKQVAPLLSSHLASGCWSKVLKDLRTNMPYNHGGREKIRWRAILACEVSAPSYFSPVIPCPSKSSRLVYTDDRFELTHPLLSKASGYRVCTPTVRLVGFGRRGISRGQQDLLRRIASGELKRSDSTLIRNDKGQWYYCLAYEVPVTNHGLDAGKTAVLTPLRQSSRRPFELVISGGERWTVGDGIAMEAQCRRLIQRRASMRHRYRDGAGKGHGKTAFFRKLRPMSRGVRDAENTFRKHMANEVLRFCLRTGAGTVEYREPTMPLRECLWFEQRGVPFDWTAFGAYLAFFLEKNGIQQVFRHKRKRLPVRIGKPEHRTAYPDQWPQKDAG